MPRSNRLNSIFSVYFSERGTKRLSAWLSRVVVRRTFGSPLLAVQNTVIHRILALYYGAKMRNEGVIRSQGREISCNIWKLMSPGELSGRRVHGSVSSKVLAATGISKIKVTRIRKKENILINERQFFFFVNTGRVTAKEGQHCCSCRNFDVVIGRIRNLNLQKAKGRL